MTARKNTRLLCQSNPKIKGKKEFASAIALVTLHALTLFAPILSGLLAPSIITAIGHNPVELLHAQTIIQSILSLLACDNEFLLHMLLASICSSILLFYYATKYIWWDGPWCISVRCVCSALLRGRCRFQEGSRH